MRLRVAVGGVSFAFLLALVLGVSGTGVPGGGQALGAATTVSIISGDIQVRHAGTGFNAAQDGELLAAGDTIRTGPDSRAVLTYFDGSTVTIEPNTELVIESATAEPDGSTVILMTQNLGRTWHVVTHLLTASSRYEVRTPAATASVRGTAFTVDVENDGQTPVTTVTTTEGRVVAAAAPDPARPDAAREVVVGAGQTASTKQGSAPEQPKPAPAPERKVTVTIETQNSLIVDPLGRMNGFKDGKLILQTPGAKVERSGGQVVVILPDIPDGRVAVVVESDKGSKSAAQPVGVHATVEDKGKPPVSASTLATVAKPADDGKASGGSDTAKKSEPVKVAAVVVTTSDQKSGATKVEVTKTTDAVKTTDVTKTTDATKTTDTAKAADTTKTTGTTKSSDTSKSTESAKTTDTTKSTDTAKANDPTKVTVESKSSGFVPQIDLSVPTPGEAKAKEKHEQADKPDHPAKHDRHE